MISTVVQCNNNLCFVGSPVNLYRTSTSWTGWLRVVEMQKSKQPSNNILITSTAHEMKTFTRLLVTSPRRWPSRWCPKYHPQGLFFGWGIFSPRWCSSTFYQIYQSAGTILGISGRFICHPSGPGQDKMSPFQHVIPYRSCETSSSACETGDTVPHQHYHLHLHDLVHLSSTHWSRESFGSEHHSCVGHHGVFIRRCRLFSQD